MLQENQTNVTCETIHPQGRGLLFVFKRTYLPEFIQVRPLQFCIFLGKWFEGPLENRWQGKVKQVYQV